MRTSRTMTLALLILMSLTAAATATVCEFTVPVCGQEMSEWCWAGCSQAILDYYGSSLTQTEIALYGTDGANIWNWLWGSSQDPRRYGIDMILDHFAGIPTTAYGTPLSFPASQDEICSLTPFVIRWGWSTGGGHFLVAWGASDEGGGQYLSYMNPLPVGSGGHHVASYDWLLQDGSHTWTHTLTTESVQGGVRLSVLPAGLEAPWILEGPGGFLAQGEGDTLLVAMPAGDYSVSWLSVAEFASPSPATVAGTHQDIGTLTLTGAYQARFTRVAGIDGPSRGVAMADIDGDGDQDVAVARHGAANLILRNDGGVLSDIAAGPAAAAGAAAGVLFGDFDDDGVMDLFWAKPGEPDVLLHGAGDGTFDTSLPVMGLGDTGEARGAAWCDYDGDGLLDLAVVRDGADNLLYRNYGDIGGAFFFAPVGGAAALPGAGCGLAWGDADNDGDADLYVTNRGEANVLLLYDPFTGFFDGTDAALANIGAAGGAAWGDADNDGDLDLYLGNAPGLDVLLRNNGGSFAGVGSVAPASGGDTRGVVWGDFDNDGDLDLYLARHGESDLLLRNDGAMSFLTVTVPDSDDDAMGAAAGDLDGDGDLDVYVAVDGGPDRLMLNELTGGHWLHLDLHADGANRDAVGARVRLFADGTAQTREIAFGSGYWSMDSPTVEFGLGGTTVVDSVTVRWPDGATETWTAPPIDRRLDLVQNAATAIREPVAAAGLRLAPPSPNPCNPRTTVAYTLTREGPVRLTVHDLKGRTVATLVHGHEPAGAHHVVWEGTDARGREVASGSYLLVLKAEGAEQRQRVMLVR